MGFGLWILAGLILFAAGFAIICGVVALEQKRARLLERRRLRRLADEAMGLMICKPGLGWVPANSRYHGR